MSKLGVLYFLRKQKTKFYTALFTAISQKRHFTTSALRLLKKFRDLSGEQDWARLMNPQYNKTQDAPSHAFIIKRLVTRQLA